MEQIYFPLQFPSLDSKRISLRMIHDADAGVIFRLYSDESVMKQRGEPVYSEIIQAEKLVFYWRKLFAEMNGLRWGITFRENNQLVGSIGFKQIFHQHRRADLGYELDPAYWNKGIMTEAVQLVTDYGMKKMNLHSIEANITPAHVASKRILEKNGFKMEAHFRENFFYMGWWDSAVYSKINKAG
ncbi:MAG: GNAT family N-acetyltransferase [Bacteroidia bacterium]